MFDKLKKTKMDKHKGYDKHSTKRFIDSLDDDFDKENEVDEEKEQINDLLSTTIFGFLGFILSKKRSLL